MEEQEKFVVEKEEKVVLEKEEQVVVEEDRLVVEKEQEKEKVEKIHERTNKSYNFSYSKLKITLSDCVL